MSAWFVVTANAWMNAPAGFTLDRNGDLMSVDPIAAMMNPATWAQTTHMIIAAYMVSGFAVAAFYAWRQWRGDRSLYVRRGMSIGLLLGCLMTPLQMFSGDFCAKVVAKTQPVKFAAMEATFETQKRAPLHIGGIPNEETGEVNFSIEIPAMLSFLAHGDFDAEVQGLEVTSHELRPPVAVVHIAFQIMVGIGGYLFLLAVWSALRWYRKQPAGDSKWFLWVGRDRSRSPAVDRLRVHVHSRSRF
jgi:cytochrome d ubiquinol oxidase subunit I